MNIAIFGTWRATPNDALYESARALGEKLTQLGCRIVTGGYAGVMEAACRGSAEAGGCPIGVTCPDIDALLPANQWIRERICTHTVPDRLSTMFRLSQAVVFFPGRGGTFTELALGAELREKGKLRFPLILMGDFWLPFFEWRVQLISGLPYDVSNEDSGNTLYKSVDSVEEAVTEITAMIS